MQTDSLLKLRAVAGSLAVTGHPLLELSGNARGALTKDPRGRTPKSAASTLKGVGASSDRPETASQRDERRMDALVVLLLVLSVTTGLVDAVSVLGLGKVFTAKMTGNVVFLGFALAGVPGYSWPLYMMALVSFALGAVAAGRIAARHSGSGHRQWLFRAAAAETALLWLAALAALNIPPAGENDSIYAAIALTAAAMGARNATIRQLKVPDLTTTLVTLTIAGLASESTLAGGANPNLARRVLAIAAFLVGAVAGALLLTRFGPAAPLFIAGLAVATSTWLLVAGDAV